MFNKRHYEFVASIIRQTRLDMPQTDRNNEALNKLVWNYVDAFKADNEAFDGDRFYNATVDGHMKRPRQSEAKTERSSSPSQSEAI